MQPLELIDTSSLSRVLDTPIRDINTLYLLVPYQHVDYKLFNTLLHTNYPRPRLLAKKANFFSSLVNFATNVKIEQVSFCPLFC